MPLTGSPSRSSPWHPNDTTALNRPSAKAGTIVLERMRAAAIHASKNTPPTPTNSPRYTPIRASQISAVTTESDASGTAPDFPMPTENIIEPATGCPSAEITR